MKIHDDAGFDKANEWLIQRGEQIAMIDLEIKNPLLDAKRKDRLKAERAEHMRLYDIVDAEMALYKRERLFNFKPYEPRFISLEDFKMTDDQLRKRDEMLEKVFDDAFEKEEQPQTALDAWLDD